MQMQFQKRDKGGHSEASHCACGGGHTVVGECRSVTSSRLLGVGWLWQSRRNGLSKVAPLSLLRRSEREEQRPSNLSREVLSRIVLECGYFSRSSHRADPARRMIARRSFTRLIWQTRRDRARWVACGAHPRRFDPSVSTLRCNAKEIRSEHIHPRKARLNFCSGQVSVNAFTCQVIE